MKTLIISDGFDQEKKIAEGLALTDGGARGIILRDETSSAEERERFISMLRVFTSEIYIPVFTCGNLFRLEDIKKRLYAGCAGVFSPEGGDTGAELIKEGALRFGEDRVFEGMPSLPETAAADFESLKTNSDGLVPCIVSEEGTGEVLMLAYMNKEAYDLTARTGRMTYWSRSRGEIWVKGETSGHYQYLRRMSVDCDNDTLLAVVRQKGAACHTGNHSCFYTDIYKSGREASDPARVLKEVYDVIADRRAHPKEGSYTNYLFREGIDKILKKWVRRPRRLL